MSKRNYVIAIFFISLLLLMITMPQVTAYGCRQGLMLWIKSIVPQMFPFFLICNVIKNLGIPNKIPWKVYPFVMAILSGYPVGAKLSAEYYKLGYISSNELFYLLSYSMVTGPAFIIGTIGVEFLDSYKWGVIIALGHYIGAILNGVLYKKNNNNYKKINKKPYESLNISKAMSSAIADSFKSIFIILAYIILFLIIISFIDKSGLLEAIFSFFPYQHKIICEGIIKGLLEITIGSKVISYSTVSKLFSASAISFLVSFGGLSVLGQSLTMTTGCNIKTFDIFKIKITHGIVSALLTFSFGTFVIYF